MASTVFVNGQTLTDAGWFNDVNTVAYKGFPNYLSIAVSLSYSDTGILGQFASNTAGYNQLVIQNTNSGTSSSASFLASNDQGTSTSNYVEIGINSSTYTGTSPFGQAGYGYVASATTDLAIGTYGTNSIHFVVNNGTTDAMTISGGGAITFPGSSAITLPTFTVGTTQISTDNSTKLATTAYVTTAVGAAIGSAVLLTGNQTVAGIKTFSSAPTIGSASLTVPSGSAPLFAARAWCIFNGATTGTNAPTAGGNIASVTRNGTGDYTATFSTALPDANYAVVITCDSGGNGFYARTLDSTTPRTTTAFRFNTLNNSASGTDSTLVAVTVYR